MSSGLREHKTFARWGIGIPVPPLRQQAGPGDFSSYDSMVFWVFLTLALNEGLYGLYCLMAGM